MTFKLSDRSTLYVLECEIGNYHVRRSDRPDGDGYVTAHFLPPAIDLPAETIRPHDGEQSSFAPWAFRDVKSAKRACLHHLAALRGTP